MFETKERSEYNSWFGVWESLNTGSLDLELAHLIFLDSAHYPLCYCKNNVWYLGNTETATHWLRVVKQ